MESGSYAAWRGFPEDILLFHVLPRLPILHRLRLRLVCSRWRTLIMSGSYLKHCKSMASSSSSVLVTVENDDDDYKDRVISVRAYDESLNSLVPVFNPSNDRLPITSAEGLVCFRDFSSCHPLDIRFIVCNPVLNQELLLPAIRVRRDLNIPPHSVCLVPKTGGSGFFLIHADKRPLVFDSATDIWKEISFRSLFPAHQGFTGYHTSGVVVIGYVAYILVFSRVPEFWMIPNLIRYDLIHQEMTLCKALDKRVSRLPVEPCLFVLDGQLMMIGFLELEGMPYSNLCVWMLDKDALQWDLRMQNQTCSNYRFDLVVGDDWEFNDLRDRFYLQVRNGSDIFDNKKQSRGSIVSMVPVQSGSFSYTPTHQNLFDDIDPKGDLQRDVTIEIVEDYDLNDHSSDDEFNEFYDEGA